jgi:uncharacterized membrane protein (DUF2068 family)
MKLSALALALAAAGLLFPAAGMARTTTSADTAVLGAASLRLRGETSSAVISWLTRQRGVRSAALGPDHRTIEVRFRDGGQAAILPSLTTTVRLGGLRPLLRAAAPAQAPGARAAVWEPFATELGLGPHAGDVEVQLLQAAGFSVDQAYDTTVTVASMASLASYAVVYMHTHSGLTQSGDGVLATGQLDTNDPSVAPLISDGSVIPVGVAGSSDTYYGITSH